jgi:hypothetical protein
MNGEVVGVVEVVVVRRAKAVDLARFSGKTFSRSPVQRHLKHGSLGLLLRMLHVVTLDGIRQFFKS